MGNPPSNQSLDPVSSDELVLRRVPGNQYDQETGSVHAQAFTNDADPRNGGRTNSHSVSRETYTSASKLQSLAPDPARFGVVAVAVREYEAMEQTIKPDPTDDDEGHCNAVGDKPNKVRNHLRKRAVVKITPPPV